MSKQKGCRIGIIGGTFDPIHYGHLLLAEEARVRFELDLVTFIPVGRPPHKVDSQISDSAWRYQMTELATASNKYFKVSPIEIVNEGISYTIKTIRAFKEQLGPEDQLYYITGADAVVTIDTWKDYKSLLGLCGFIGATRPGINLELLKEKIDHLRDTLKADILLLEMPALSISSTEIRNRVANGLSIKYLLPEPVEAFIEENGLYRSQE